MCVLFLDLKLESSHGLNVAFRMLDLDGNATLGRAEFQEVYDLLLLYTSMFSKGKMFLLTAIVSWCMHHVFSIKYKVIHSCLTQSGPLSLTVHVL